MRNILNFKTILRSIMVVLFVAVGVYAFTVPTGTITQTPATTFFADSTIADQGAATSSGNQSIKDFVDAIGATKKGTIYLVHTGAADETTYTLTTSETITSNISLIMENGAILDGAGTLTQNGNFPQEPYKVFGSSITVTFGAGAVKEAYPGWWGDYATDAGAAINSAINSIRTIGGVVRLPVGTGIQTTAIDLTDIANKITIIGSGESTILKGTLATVMFDCTGSTALRFRDFNVYTDYTDANPTGVKPSAAFLLARSTVTGTGGSHSFEGISTTGGACFGRAVVYSYASEGNSYRNSRFHNWENGAACVWITDDNDGTGEDIASVHTTIETGVHSNSVFSFYNVYLLEHGTGDADLLRLRRALNLDFTSSFWYNDEGRSLIYLDNSTLGSHYLNFSDIRADPGATVSYMAYINGTATSTNWTFNRIYYEVTEAGLFAAGNSKVQNLEWDKISQVFSGVVSGTFVDGDVTVATESMAITGHGLITMDTVQLTTTGVLPAGLALSTTYYVIRTDDDNFKLASTATLAEAGTAVDITAAVGGGTHTVTQNGVPNIDVYNLDYATIKDTGLIRIRNVALQSDIRGEESDISIVTNTNGILTFSETGLVKTAYGYYHDRGNSAGFDFAVGDYTTDETWNDLDLSAIVPTNAKAVHISLTLRDDVIDQIMKFRENGNTSTTNVAIVSTQVAAQSIYADFIVAIDSDGIIEYYGAAIVFQAIDTKIRGWWY